MSTWERCAHCGVEQDTANLELIFQEGSTYPDYWICRDEASCEAYVRAQNPGPLRGCVCVHYDAKECSILRYSHEGMSREAAEEDVRLSGGCECSCHDNEEEEEEEEEPCHATSTVPSSPAARQP